jgi:hypothetical protein
VHGSQPISAWVDADISTATPNEVLGLGRDDATAPQTLIIEIIFRRPDNFGIKWKIPFHGVMSLYDSIIKKLLDCST